DPGHLKIGVSVRHIFKPISYLEIQLLSGVSGGYISVFVIMITKISRYLFKKLEMQIKKR
ncbi:hypothetical protein, partial [Escherichia coli]|uniref:hypothetical protein n=1 Tax=Escherichia coli TaxID=562 RepID=UPI001F2E0D61